MDNRLRLFKALCNTGSVIHDCTCLKCNRIVKFIVKDIIASDPLLLGVCPHMFRHNYCSEPPPQLEESDMTKIDYLGTVVPMLV